MANYSIPNSGGDGSVRTNTTAMGQNMPYGGLEWRSTRTPDYRVYVYNVSPRTFNSLGTLKITVPGVTDTDVTEVAQGDPRDPWKYVNQETGKPKAVIHGKENERWHYVTSFPQPILLTKQNDASNMTESYEQDAIRYVVDLINPDNLGKTLDTMIPPERRFSVGNDLSQKGVFFSFSNPPFAQDVRAAIDRMEAYYKALLEKAATLDLTDKKLLSEELAGNPDYAFAAEYFGKTVTWRANPQRTIECPNCGEQKPAGRLFHAPSFGGICVEQTQKAWQSAVRSGVKRMDDVPEEFRWAAEKVAATK
jgi:hypothetical protein